MWPRSVGKSACLVAGDAVNFEAVLHQLWSHIFYPERNENLLGYKHVTLVASYITAVNIMIQVIGIVEARVESASIDVGRQDTKRWSAMTDGQSWLVDTCGMFMVHHFPALSSLDM